jgi:hypothetical protein
MRRSFAVGAATLVLVLVTQPEPALAQLGGVGADPFSFYYGYYLPHQAYIAAQPRAIDPINQVVANRQYTAQTDRAALYDPISPYGDDESDPFRPNAQGSRDRRAGRQNFTMGSGSNSNANGNGPAMYYNRTASYFPALRAGRGPNRNVATLRAGRGGGGGMGGMPQMPNPYPSPGPR